MIFRLLYFLKKRLLALKKEFIRELVKVSWSPVSVSIIIPTYSRPTYLAETIRVYYQQVGVEKCQIVLVDSGLDAKYLNSMISLEKPKHCSLEVIRIASAGNSLEFNHGNSRYVGSKKAIHQWKVITVDDCSPGSEDLIAVTANTVNSLSWHAASLSQKPRSNHSFVNRWLVESRMNNIFGSSEYYRKLNRKSFGKKLFLDDVWTIHSPRARNIEYSSQLIFGEDIDVTKQLTSRNLWHGWLSNRHVHHSHDYSLKDYYLRVLTDALFVNYVISLNQYEFSASLDHSSGAQEKIINNNLCKVGELLLKNDDIYREAKKLTNHLIVNYSDITNEEISAFSSQFIIGQRALRLADELLDFDKQSLLNQDKIINVLKYVKSRMRLCEF